MSNAISLFTLHILIRFCLAQLSSFVAPLEKISFFSSIFMRISNLIAEINNSFWDHFNDIENKAGTTIIQRLVTIYQIGSKLFLIPTYIFSVCRLHFAVSLSCAFATNYFLIFRKFIWNLQFSSFAIWNMLKRQNARNQITFHANE